MSKEVIADLVTVVGELVDVALSVRGSSGNAPTRDSQASHEMSAPLVDGSEDQEPIKAAFSLAALQFGAAEDFTSSFSRLMSSEPRPIGASAMARLSLESSSRAWWLLDHEIDGRQRAYRGLQERLRSLTEAKKIGRETGWAPSLEPRGLTAEADHKIDQLRQRAGELGFATVQLPPSATNLVGDLLSSVGFDPEQGTSAYRYLAGFVHGTAAALLRVFEDTGTDARHPLQAIVRPALKPAELGWAIVFVGIAYAKAFDELVYMFGWPTDAWVTSRDRALSILLDGLRKIPEYGRNEG